MRSDPEELRAPAQPRSAERPFVGVIGEPNPWTVRALETILAQHGLQVVHAPTARDVVEQVAELEPDVVVVSDALPDLSASETCRRVRAIRTFNPATPVLVTSSELVDETRQVENLLAGAWDTLRLPANAEQLLLKIRRFVEAKAVSDAAGQAEMFDDVTGFYNLRGLLRRAEEEAAEAWRFRRTLSCMAFGPVLPPSGVDEGPDLEPAALRTRPELERELAEVFRRMARRSDVVGRLSPAEFVVVAPSTDEGATIRMGERLLAEMRHLTVPVRGQERRVEMRAGYYAPGNPAPTSIRPSDLVSRAGGALRRSQSHYDPDEEILPWKHGDLLVLPGSRSGPAEPSEAASSS